MISRIVEFFRNLHHWQWSGHVALVNTDGDLITRFYRPTLDEAPPPKMIFNTKTEDYFIDTGRYDYHGGRMYRHLGAFDPETYAYTPGTE